MSTLSPGHTLSWKLFAAKAPPDIQARLEAETSPPAQVDAAYLESLRDGFAEGSDANEWLGRLSGKLRAASGDGEPAQAPGEARAYFQRGSPPKLHPVSEPLETSVGRLVALAEQGRVPSQRDLELLVADVARERGDAGLQDLLTATDRALPDTLPARSRRRVVGELTSAVLAWPKVAPAPQSRAETMGRLLLVEAAAQVAGGLRAPLDVRRAFGLTGVGEAARTLGLEGGGVLGFDLDALDVASVTKADWVVLVDPDPEQARQTHALVAVLLAVDEKAQANGWSDEQRLEELKARVLLPLRDDRPWPTAEQQRELAKQEQSVRAMLAELSTSGLDHATQAPLHQATRMSLLPSRTAFLDSDDAPARVAHLTRLAREGRLLSLTAEVKDPGLADAVNALARAFDSPLSVAALGTALEKALPWEAEAVLETLGRLDAREDARALTSFYRLEKEARDTAAGEETGSWRGTLPPSKHDQEGAAARLSLFDRVGGRDVVGTEPLAAWVGPEGLGAELLALEWQIPGVRAEWLYRGTSDLYLDNWKKNSDVKLEDGPRTREGLLSTLALRRKEAYARPEDARRRLQEYALLKLSVRDGGINGLTDALGVRGSQFSRDGDDFSLFDGLDWPLPSGPEDLPAKLAEFEKGFWTDARKVALCRSSVSERSYSEDTLAFFDTLARTCDDFEGLSLCLNVMHALKTDKIWDREYRIPFTSDRLRRAVHICLGLDLEAEGVAPPDLDARIQAVKSPDDAVALIRALAEHTGRPLRIHT